MQSFTHYVLRHPETYAKLRQELDGATERGDLSRMPQWSEVQALPYFQACLKEAMRLRPAVGLNITRLVPPGGAEIDGVPYPGGTRVAINAWVLHRDTAIFGKDADVYRPERWLEGDARTMDRHMYQVCYSFGGNTFVQSTDQSPSSEVVRICALVRIWHFWR